jgi:hypothetical protein
MNVFYSVESNVNEVSQLDLSNKIRSVLNDKRGWKQNNINFLEVNKPILEELSKNDENVVKIKLEYDHKTDELCRMNNLSCYRLRHNKVPDIILNLKNWLGGSLSNLPVDRYQTYLINHEMGHHLGFDHKTCPGIKCPSSVMQQLTKGPSHIYPCYENEWPLKGVDVINRHHNLRAILIFTAIIILSIIFIIYLEHRLIDYIITRNEYRKIK